MALAKDMRNQLYRYLSGVLPLPELQEGLGSVDGSNDAEAKGIALAVEWAFHWLEQGTVTADELRVMLRAIADGESGSPKLAVAMTEEASLQQYATAFVGLVQQSGSSMNDNAPSAMFQQPSSGSSPKYQVRYT